MMTKKNNKIKRGNYYMYGNHAVISAANNPTRIIKGIYCLEKNINFLQNKIKNHSINIVDINFINKKLEKNALHQGVIAEVEQIFNNNFLPSKDDSHYKIAILDQITDPHNIGAIIRSAAAFNIDEIILPKNNCPEENAIIAKTACGCLELVKVTTVTNLKNTMDTLKNNGFWIAGLDGKGTSKLSELSSINKIAIVIGSEGTGMRKLTKDNCDLLVKIPMNSKVESLNASVAASIVFYATL